MTACRLLLFLLLCLCGCDRDAGPLGESRQYDRAISTVQNTSSRLPGTTTVQALDLVLASLATEGFQVKPEGWTCTLRNDTFFIWYNVIINGHLVRFHWILASDRSVSPGNEITRAISEIR